MSTFDIPREAVSAGIERVKVEDLLLVPKCRKPSRMMPEEHITMSQGKDMILGLTVEDSPEAWTNLGKAAGMQVKKLEGNDSLFAALAHQVFLALPHWLISICLSDVISFVRTHVNGV